MPMKPVWRLVTNHEPDKVIPALRWTVERGYLALGWGVAGDLIAAGYRSSEAIAQVLRERGDSQTAGMGGRCLWDFWRTMRVGDLVILSTGEYGLRQAVMEVTGDYEWRNKTDHPSQGNYQHQRRARYTGWPCDQMWVRAGAKHRRGQHIRFALIRLPKDVDVKPEDEPRWLFDGLWS
jgi:hypothetical protein